MKITEKIVKFFYKNWSISLIIIIGLLPIIFFKKGLLLLAGEGITSLDINHYYKYYDLYSWREQLSLGQPNLWTPHLFILDFFFYVFSLIGFSLRTVEIFWFIFLWVSAGLAIYFLIKTISDNHKYKLWGFFAALLYLFNTFTMVKPIDENFRLVHVALPLILVFFIKGLREEKSTTKYALLIGLSSLIFASASVNPPAVSIIWIVLFFYFCFDALINKKFSFNKIFFVFKILFFYVLLNSWWMFTTIPVMIFSSEPLREIMTFSILHTKLFETFRFLGKWAFKSGYQEVHYFPYHPFYYGKSIIVTFLSFLIPMLAFSCLFFKKRSKYIMFFAGLVAVGIFLVKGTSEPFGRIYNFVWKNIPGFWVFREPFTKFTPLVIFSSSVLFGCTISEISKKISIHFRDRKNGPTFNFLFLFCIASMVCITVFPIFTRQIFREKSIRAMKSQYVKFPQYWLDIGDWFKSHDKVNKILILPKSGLGAPYDWEHGIVTAGPVATLLIPNPLLTYRSPSSKGQKLVNNLYSYFYPESKIKLVNFLRFLGVKYLLQQNDLSWKNALSDTYSPVIIQDILKNQEGVELFKQFGKLDVYKVQDDHFLPYFYVPQNIIYSPNNVEVLPDMLSFEDYPLRSGIYLAAEQPEISSQSERNKFLEAGRNMHPSDAKLRNKEILERADEVFVKAEERNIRYWILDIEKRENIKNSVPFPYVKHRPGSLEWKLARLKEKYEEWRVRKDRGKLIDKKLFYAGKRISELEKFGADNADRELIARIMELYQAKMEEAIGLVRNMVAEGDRDTVEIYRNILKLRAYWERHKERTEETGKLENWEEVLGELDEKIKSLEKKFDLRRLEYSFEILKEGEYEIYGEKEEIWKLGNREIEVDGKGISLEEVETREGGWISLEKRDFKEGKHKLVLSLPELENLVGDNWQKLKEVEIKDKGVGLSRQEFFPNAKELIFQKINNWQGNNLYYLTFDYKTEEGSLGIGVLEKKTEYQKEEKVVKIQKILEGSLKSKNKEWEKFEVVIKPDPDTLEARIYFYALAEPDQFAEVNFRNVRIYRIVQPKIILRSEIKKYAASPRNKIEIPKITFVKVNPTKYRVKVEGAKEPYTLVFSESFHKGWKAYINGIQNDYEKIVASYFDGEIKEGTHRNTFLEKATFETWGKEPIAEDRHYLVNGYANSWYITPGDVDGEEDYEIIIEFWPQRLFYIGLGISLITFLGCLGYLGYNFTKRRIESGK